MPSIVINIPEFPDKLDIVFNFLGIFVNVIGIIIGIWLIKHQLKKQHLANIKIQEKEYRDNLNLEVYNVLMSTVRRASEKLSPISTRIFSIPFNLRFTWDQRRQWKSKINIVSDREQQLISSFYKAIGLVNQIVLDIERYEIVIPQFKIFHKIIMFQEQLLSYNFKEFFEYTSGFLPVDLESKKASELGVDTPWFRKEPTTQDLDKISDLSITYYNDYVALQAYLWDFSVCLQNELLGQIFKRSVNLRKPIDPVNLVISTNPDKIKEIENYIKDNKHLIDDEIANQVI